MKQICTLLFYCSFAIVAFAQKKSNLIIDKNETEITSFIIGDLDLLYGGQMVYRLHVQKKIKLGAGILYGANYDNSYYQPGTFGYGAVFADVLQFLGNRQKWGFGGQLGHGIYNRDYSNYKIKAGIYFTISANYRAIVSKKILINTSLFTGYRNFHNTLGYRENNVVLLGIKAGIIF